MGLIQMKRYTVAILVAGAFVTILMLNTYFNFTSGIAINKYGETLEDKFYLSGPDPYYNMRLLQITLKTGHFPFIGGVHGDKDPLLNYPLHGSGGRPPLFTMLTIGVGKFFSLFMDETDAMGYAMQFIPALYGALLVVPVYFIARTLFNRKIAIIAAWIIPLIPIHLSSGHGSAFSLYDTDSAILLTITTTLMFLIMAMKEKDVVRSTIFAAMAGVMAAGLAMIWVAGEYIFVLIAAYAIVQMIVDIFANKIDVHIVRVTLTTLVVAYIIAFPILYVKRGLALTPYLFSPIAVAIFGAIYLWIGKKNIPWILSLPSIFIVGSASLTFLYLIRNTTNQFLRPLAALSNVIFKGVYAKKVSLTIAEASSFGFSRTVMSFGPVLYWLGWIGFFYLLYIYYKKKWKREYMVLILWFAVESWLVHKAGRFLNDLVPSMAILSAAAIWFIIEKSKFAEMMKNLKGLGGGWYGIKKAVKLRHVFSVIFISFFVIFPNGWLSLDAALPSKIKEEFHSDKLGAFGLGLHTEQYWTDAFSWLRHQTENYSIEEKPGFISWWDYGFYCVAVAKTPTVADNFQEGIPPAANFHTSLSENEAVSVMIVRLAEGDMNKHGGRISDKLKEVFEGYLGEENATLLVNIIEDPEKYAPSYGEVISKEYDGKKYHVRADNARYHDAVDILTKLDDENLTMLYRDVQNATGYSIRYYGVEGYDVNIFNVFDFLADKGSFGYETTEDKFFKLWYIANKTLQKLTPDEVKNITESMTRENMERIYGRFIPYTERKDAFYDSMVYHVYLGNIPKSIFENYSYYQTLFFWYYPSKIPQNIYNQYSQYSQYLLISMSPTAGMKHFYAQYISPVTDEKPYRYYPRPGRLCTGLPAVVIAKYYEGAVVKGKIVSNGEPFEGVVVDVQQNISIYGINKSIVHDSTITASDGSFSVIVPAGDVTLYIHKGSGSKAIELKKIHLNISEEQATRVANWKIDIGTIDIPKGNVKGIVFWDKDGDGTYNASIDKKIDATVTIDGKRITTHNGKYEVKNLLPSSYPIDAEKKGYTAENAGNVSVKPNETIWYNISMVPMKVEVSGKVWYDANGNGVKDENESVVNTPIKFNVISAPDKNAANETIYTNSTGHYTISLSPAKYSVEVSYTVRKGNESITYSYHGTLNLKIGETRRTFDIKLRRE